MKRASNTAYSLNLGFSIRSSITMWVCVCVCVCLYVCVFGGRVVSPHIQQFSDTSWVSYNSTQFQHCPPKDSIRFHRLRAQSHKAALHFRCQLQVQVVTCTSDCSYKAKVPMISSLSLINLLERLTEFRETFYLLEYWLIIKSYNSGSARWKHKARYVERSCTFHTLSRLATVLKSLHGHQTRSSLNLVLLGF